MEIAQSTSRVSDRPRPGGAMGIPVLLATLLLLLGLQAVSGFSAPALPGAERGISGDARMAGTPSDLPGARSRLEARFQEAADRLRKLRSDSASIPPVHRARLATALHAADILLSDIHLRFSEMRNLEVSGRRAAWEFLFERTEKSLFGLDRFLGLAEAVRVPLDPMEVSGPGNQGRDTL